MHIETEITVLREIGGAAQKEEVLSVSGTVINDGTQYVVALDKGLDVDGAREIDQAEEALIARFEGEEWRTANILRLVALLSQAELELERAVAKAADVNQVVFLARFARDNASMALRQAAGLA